MPSAIRARAPCAVAALIAATASVALLLGYATELGSYPTDVVSDAPRLHRISLRKLARTPRLEALASPQVAARGAHHWRVEKRVEDEMTLSTVRTLDGANRVDEIARMLSGEHVTQEARAAAEALMAG